MSKRSSKCENCKGNSSEIGWTAVAKWKKKKKVWKMHWITFMIGVTSSRLTE